VNTLYPCTHSSAALPAELAVSVASDPRGKCDFPKSDYKVEQRQIKWVRI